MGAHYTPDEKRASRIDKLCSEIAALEADRIIQINATGHVGGRTFKMLCDRKKKVTALILEIETINKSNQ